MFTAAGLINRRKIGLMGRSCTAQLMGRIGLIKFATSVFYLLCSAVLSKIFLDADQSVVHYISNIFLGYKHIGPILWLCIGTCSGASREEGVTV